ncbi:hypothetical protein ACWC4E_33925 [Streptomyces sp. NPDC001273]|uniref:hypothetical protein n=1 Tax=unclassified Streptomyces TaxID=2593676 RepID=UPI00340D681B
MDAGLAAVLGAMAGSLGAIGAAFATRSGMRQQSLINARAEHQRHRRESRQAAYEAFAVAADAVDSFYYAQIRESDNLSNFDMQTALEVRRALELARLRVTLAGPASLADISQDVWLQLANLQHVAIHLSRSGGTQRERQSFTTALNDLRGKISKYMSSAQSALDQDGT